MTIEHLIRYVKLLAFFVIIWVGIWVFNTYSCRKLEGSEMEPALSEGVKFTAPKIRHPNELQPDDFIFFQYVHAGKAQQVFAGRVIALPGERVKIEKGEVSVNGEKLKADYVATKNRTLEDFEEIIVPRDTVFVLADNRRQAAAFDSRGIGPVPAWAILGKIR